MEGCEPSEAFVSEVRHALQNLYDPTELRKNRLQDIIVTTQHNPMSALRRTLIDAIRALRPGSDVPPDANAWRIYHLLTARYVEQASQNEVASTLAISPRQLRRVEWEAARVLAHLLWARQDVPRQAERALDETHAAQRPPAGDEHPYARDDELAWVKASFPSGTARLTELLNMALDVVRPLADAMGTKLDLSPMPEVTVTGQIAPMRQCVVNVVSSAIFMAPDGTVRMAGRAHGDGPALIVRSEPAEGAVLRRDDEVEASLGLARQLVDLFAGELSIAALGSPGQCFQATLRFPSLGQVPILVVDDNVDALRLIERYLASTRYQASCVRDPVQVVPLAEQLRPAAILLDIMLPDIDGWELLGALREHPSLRGTPLIVCSILPHERLAGILGAAAFLPKPIGRQALLEVLERLTIAPSGQAE